MSLCTIRDREARGTKLGLQAHVKGDGWERCWFALRRLKSTRSSDAEINDAFEHGSTRSSAMIIVRSPLRITLGGGGTDLASYYREHEGFLIAAAIDKYVYVTVIRPFTPGVYLKYSKIEHVEAIEDVQHPIIRECLKEFELRAGAD